jgi:hypothetical protein
MLCTTRVISANSVVGPLPHPFGTLASILTLKLRQPQADLGLWSSSVHSQRPFFVQILEFHSGLCVGSDEVLAQEDLRDREFRNRALAADIAVHLSEEFRVLLRRYSVTKEPGKRRVEVSQASGPHPPKSRFRLSCSTSLPSRPLIRCVLLASVLALYELSASDVSPPSPCYRIRCHPEEPGVSEFSSDP